MSGYDDLTTGGDCPTDPEPLRMAAYVDQTGRPRAQVDFPLPEHSNNQSLALLGGGLVLLGAALIAASARRPSPITPPPPAPLLPGTLPPNSDW
jgi:hypothetical protein